ncbi:MAG: DNA polymerase, partial [Candidatus Aenigmarchaeota archaeon]|nr:DNA polymerase [Candidatus Aenigmarchaeota archaeon]
MVKVEFCLFDIDYVLEDGKPVVRLWGKTKKGESILAEDRNFEPYFYAEVEKEYLKTNELDNFKRRIRELKDFGEKVKNIEMVEKRYLGERKTFLRLILSNPRDIPDLREIIKDWRGIKNIYEYDISFYRRYLIDKGLIPMGWVSVEGEEKKSELAVDQVFG